MAEARKHKVKKHQAKKKGGNSSSLTLPSFSGLGAIPLPGVPFENWIGNVAFTPPRTYVPGSAADLAAILQATDGEVRVANGIPLLGNLTPFKSHSSMPLVETSNTLLQPHKDILGQDKTGVSFDKNTLQLTVPGAMRLELVAKNASANRVVLRSVPVLPWITAAGAMATGSHGTGLGKPTFPDLVVAATVLLANGKLRTFSDQLNKAEMDTMRVNLGALGVIQSVTLQCDAAFRLEAQDLVRDLATTKKDLEKLCSQHEYVEILWWPHNEKCWLKLWDKTTKPPEGNVVYHLDLLAQFLGAGGLGSTLLEILKLNPSYTPVFCQALFDFVKLSLGTTVVRAAQLIMHYQAFYTPVDILAHAFPVTATDMSNARAAWDRADEVRQKYENLGVYPQNMPNHLRFTGGSDAKLSPASGNAGTAWLQLLTYKNTAGYASFYRDVEAEWLQLNGRPHWGKLWYNVDFPTLYGSAMDDFLTLRAKLDPNGRFLNSFVRGVLGI